MKTTKLQYKPDKELVKFADEFSANYRMLSVGTYVSDKDKYTIRYLSRIKESPTGARISRETKVIQLDKAVLKDKAYTPDFVFFLIISCVIYDKFPDKDIKSHDEIACDYYLTTGRATKNIMTGITKLLRHVPTEKAVDRIMNIITCLLKNSSLVQRALASFFIPILKGAINFQLNGTIRPVEIQTPPKNKKTKIIPL